MIIRQQPRSACVRTPARAIAWGFTVVPDRQPETGCRVQDSLYLDLIGSGFRAWLTAQPSAWACQLVGWCADRD